MLRSDGWPPACLWSRPGRASTTTPCLMEEGRAHVRLSAATLFQSGSNGGQRDEHPRRTGWKRHEPQTLVEPLAARIRGLPAIVDHIQNNGLDSNGTRCRLDPPQCVRNERPAQPSALMRSINSDHRQVSARNRTVPWRPLGKPGRQRVRLKRMRVDCVVSKHAQLAGAAGNPYARQVLTMVSSGSALQEVVNPDDTAIEP